MTGFKGTLDRRVGYLKSKCTTGKARLGRYCQRVLDKTANRVRFSERQHDRTQAPTETEHSSNHTQENGLYDSNRRHAPGTLLLNDAEEPAGTKEAAEAVVGGHEKAKREPAPISAAFTILHEPEPNPPSLIAQETALSTDLEQGTVGRLADHPQPTQIPQRRTVNDDSYHFEQTYRQDGALAQNGSLAQKTSIVAHKRFLEAVVSETIHEQCQNIREEVPAGMEERSQASGRDSLDLAQSDQAGLPLPFTVGQRLTSH